MEQLYVIHVRQIFITKVTINVRNIVVLVSWKIRMTVDAKHVSHIVKLAYFYQIYRHFVKSVL